MRYQREFSYDSLIEEANTKTSIPSAAIKTIIALASEFEPDRTEGFPPRLGLMGLTLKLANTVGHSMYGELSRSDVVDSKINIMLGAHILRMVLNQSLAFRSQERKCRTCNRVLEIHEARCPIHNVGSEFDPMDNPNLFDAIGKYFELNGNPQRESKIRSTYYDFCDKKDKTTDYSPNEVARAAMGRFN